LRKKKLSKQLESSTRAVPILMLQQRLSISQTEQIKTASHAKVGEMAINNEADLSLVEEVSKDLVQVQDLMPAGLCVDGVDTQNIQVEKPAQLKTESVESVRKWGTMLKCANLREVEPTGSKPPVATKRPVATWGTCMSVVPTQTLNHLT